MPQNGPGLSRPMAKQPAMLIAKIMTTACGDDGAVSSVSACRADAPSAAPTPTATAVCKESVRTWDESICSLGPNSNAERESWVKVGL